MRIYGPTDPEMSKIYNNMGGVEAELENLDAAKEYHEKAMSIDLKSHGAIHPSVARNYMNLGIVEKRLGNYKKAEEYYKRRRYTFNIILWGRITWTWV